MNNVLCSFMPLSTYISEFHCKQLKDRVGLDIYMEKVVWPLQRGEYAWVGECIPMCIYGPLHRLSH